MSLLRRFSSSGRRTTTEYTTDAGADHGSGAYWPACGSSWSGFDSVDTSTSITPTKFKGYPILLLYGEDTFVNNDPNTTCDWGSSTLIFKIQNYSGTQTGLFNYIEVMGNQYTAASAAYSTVGGAAWSWYPLGPLNVGSQLFYFTIV